MVLFLHWFQTQNDYIREWLPRRKKYLQTIMETEGRSDAICTGCDSAEGNWRCLRCIGKPVFCIGCCRETHQRLPFHRVEQWTGTHWASSWLIGVGVEVHLGHHGARCPNPGSWMDTSATFDEDEWDDDEDDPNTPPAGEPVDHADTTNGLYPRGHVPNIPAETSGQVLTVVDTSGVHQVIVRPCRCNSNQEPDDIQLLKMGLFPTSFTRIRTVFTLHVLDTYRLDNLVCNTTAYQFYKRLRRITSPAFPHSVPVRSPLFYDLILTQYQNRYRELIRVGRQWRNLKYRRWFGFAYVDREPRPAELALFCAACPQPNINLPPNWQEDENQ